MRRLGSQHPLEWRVITELFNEVRPPLARRSPAWVSKSQVIKWPDLNWICRTACLPLWHQFQQSYILFEQITQISPETLATVSPNLQPEDLEAPASQGPNKNKGYQGTICRSISSSRPWQRWWNMRPSASADNACLEAKSWEDLNKH